MALIDKSTSGESHQSVTSAGKVAEVLRRGERERRWAWVESGGGGVGALSVCVYGGAFDIKPTE